MTKAIRLQEKTQKVGFEWENAEQVWVKVEEELQEFRHELATNAPKARLESEFGDILFAIVNYARFLDIDPEAALERTNLKFKARFEYIEQHAPKSLTAMTLEEMDALWNEAKSTGL